MARPRKKNSKLSYSGLGLTRQEDKELLQKMFKVNEPSLKALIRKLLRNWLSDAVHSN